MKQIDYKKILVTFDGSELALSAIPYALSLAKTYQSQIIVLHVVNPLEQELAILSTSSAGLTTETTMAAKEQVKANIKTAKNQLAMIKAEFEKGGILKITTIVEEGDAKNLITELAKKEKCDLITIATHGRSGLGRTILGSVADYVIRHSSCPVLVIHPQKKL